MKSFKIGDKVEITGNIPFALLNAKKPLIGTITSIDGYYIMVKPRYRRWTAEFYPSELKLYKNIKEERKLKLKKINNVSKNL